jgi:hypothetical protein
MHREDHAGSPVCVGSADHALRVIAAQQHAEAVVRGVQAGELDADGLALELGRAYGLGLQALARALVKALPHTP